MTTLSATNVLAALLLVFTTSVLVVYAWLKRRYTYWERRGVQGPKPSIPFGNYSEVFTNKIFSGEFQERIYRESKDKRIVGMYMLWQPCLIINDYELSNRILAADFSHFESHGPEIDEKIDPLGVHLFNASGKHWRELRNKLTPAFTTGKLKKNFLIMKKIGDELQDALKTAADQKQEMEMRDLVARFTTDIIGNCAFGVECNSLKDENAPFRRCGQRIFTHTGLESLKVAMGFFFPEVCRLFGVSSQKKDVLDFIVTTVNDTVKHRENNNIKRNDFLDILLQIKNNTLVDDQGKKVDFGQGATLTEGEFLSQVYLFFVAGFETSSSTTSFALYELACNPDVQDRAREHIRSVLNKHNGQYTYEALNEMDYLTNIVNEALRKYPPLASLLRKCTATYKIPESNVVIEKGNMVFMPILGMQMNPEYFPDPQKFDPDRFTPGNKHRDLNKIHMPFGQGPRICIGQRFGILQSKVALAKLLDKYSFSIGKKTLIPMQLKKGFNITTPEGGLWLTVQHAS